MAIPAIRARQGIQELLGELNARLDDATRSVRFRDHIVNENMAFYAGMQWGTLNEWGLYESTDDTGEAQETYNYVAATVSSAVANMLQSTTNPEAVAAADDQASLARASAAQRLIRSVLRDGTFPFEMRYRMEIETAVKGACWAKFYFDPFAGKAKKVPKTKPQDDGSFALDLDEAGMPQLVTTFEGAIKCEFHDIIDVRPDPNASSEDEIRYIFHTKDVSRSKLESEIPVDAFGDDTTGRFEVGRRDPSQRERDMIENPERGWDGSGSVEGGRSTANEIIRVVEYWERESVIFPRGRLVVFAGDVVISYAEELPYEWPWVLRTGRNIIPNSLYARGVVADLKPMQRTINFNASKRREWVQFAMNPPILASREARISRDAFSDIIGDVLEYDGPFEPKWMQVQSIPGAMFTLEEQLVSIMKDVSTFSDISRGDAPAGIETGRALAYLHEFSTGVRMPDVMLYKEWLVRSLRKILRLIRDFYPEDRIVRIIGENGRWTARPFKRADFDLEAEIVIETDSGAPQSRALRMAEAIQLYQIGGLGDTPDAQRLRKILNYDYQDRSTTDPDEAHRSRARAEQLAITDDPTTPLEVLEQDRHDVHLEEHDTYRVSAEYFKLPMQARHAMDQHVAWHEEENALQQQDYARQQGTLLPGYKAGSAQGGGGAQAPSPYDGGQSHVAAAAAPGASPDVPPPDMGGPPSQGTPGQAAMQPTVRRAA